MTDHLFKEYNKSISTNGMIRIYPDVIKESRKENRIYKDDSDCKAASRAGIVMNFLISGTWYGYTIYQHHALEKIKRAFCIQNKAASDNEKRAGLCI